MKTADERQQDVKLQERQNQALEKIAAEVARIGELLSAVNKTLQVR